MAVPRQTRPDIHVVPQQDAPPVPRPGRCRVRLDSVPLILREMSRVYRAARSRSIPTSEASSLVWILATMVRVHADAVFDERITRLEEARHARQNSH